MASYVQSLSRAVFPSSVLHQVSSQTLSRRSSDRRDFSAPISGFAGRRATERSRRGRATRDHNGVRRLLPRALDFNKSRVAKLTHVLIHPVKKPVAIQEPALRSEKIVDRPIARENVVGAWQ